ADAERLVALRDPARVVESLARVAAVADHEEATVPLRRQRDLERDLGRDHARNPAKRGRRVAGRHRRCGHLHDLGRRPCQCLARLCRLELCGRVVDVGLVAVRERLPVRRSRPDRTREARHHRRGLHRILRNASHRSLPRDPAIAPFYSRRAEFTAPLSTTAVRWESDAHPSRLEEYTMSALRTIRSLASLVLACAMGLVAAEPASAETIALIGTGNVGAALGRRFAEQGHTVVYGSRNPAAADVARLVAETGHGASAASPADAAARSRVVV